MLYQDREGLLLTGERVLWEGRPYQGLMFQPTDALLIPFSLMWGGFAIFWNVTVWLSGAPIFFRLWGLPFLLVGIYLIVGRFFADSFVRRGQRYLVTDRRILILTDAPLRRRKSLDIKRLPALELRERGDGSGTIKFGNDSVSIWGARNYGSLTPSLAGSPQFLRIDNVRRVYDLIDRAER